LHLTKTDFKDFNILILITISIQYVELLPNKLTRKLHTSETYELPEHGQRLETKHVGAIINKQKHCATSWC